MESRETPPARRRLRWPRWLPPARVLWIGLVVLGAYGVHILDGMGLLSLIVLPIVGVFVDLLFQLWRFPSLRFPDAAIATGLFVALIFPPTASFVLSGLAVAGGIALRHALRVGGRPWFNPAVSGIVLGTLLFGLAPAWWISVGTYGEYLMLGIGGLLIARNIRSWQLPAVFLASYAACATAVHVFTADWLTTRVLLLEAVDPVMLFFGLYMVVEPRTAPASAAAQVFYGMGVAAAAAIFPLYLPSLGALVALLLGNLVVVVWRAWKQWHPVGEARAAKARRRHGILVNPDRWPVGTRFVVATTVLLLLGVFAHVAVPASSTPSPLISSGGSPPTGGGGSTGTSSGGVTASGCSTDNPSIPSSERTTLHNQLGPSVLLSYNANTGVVVFYDPVNQVTVTETDLYEDYGFAEFNGDDYAVNGCQP